MTMESKLYFIDGKRLEEMIREQYKQFGIDISDEDIERELKALPVQDIMNQYIEATYIRLNNLMFEEALKKVSERV